jgi:Fe-S-cluster containining protein
VTTHDSPAENAPVGPRYPFGRTTCACRYCAISCEHLPGALSPSDVPIIAAHLGYSDPETFARENLQASDGPTLKLNDGRVLSLPTLVPSAGADGSCRFYQSGRCAIHAVSPFGCSHIDAHMPEAEFIRRSNTLYAELLNDYERAGPYSSLTAHLRSLGCVAPPLTLRRAKLADAMRREGL